MRTGSQIRKTPEIGRFSMAMKTSGGLYLFHRRDSYVHLLDSAVRSGERDFRDVVLERYDDAFAELRMADAAAEMEIRRVVLHGMAGRSLADPGGSSESGSAHAGSGNRRTRILFHLGFASRTPVHPRIRRTGGFRTVSPAPETSGVESSGIPKRSEGVFRLRIGFYDQVFRNFL